MTERDLDLKPFEPITEHEYLQKQRSRLSREELVSDAVVSLYINSGSRAKEFFQGDIHIDTIDKSTQRQSGLYVVSATVNIGNGNIQEGYGIRIDSNHYTLSPRGIPYGFLGATLSDSDFDNSLKQLLDEKLPATV